MKITKARLKQIVKEETEKILTEKNGEASSSWSDALRKRVAQLGTAGSTDRLARAIQGGDDTFNRPTDIGPGRAAKKAAEMADRYNQGGKTPEDAYDARVARGDRQKIDPETGKIVYQTTDMARPALDMTSGYSTSGQSEIDPDTEYDKQMDADVSAQVASGGIEFGDSIRPGGGTDPTATGATQVADIMSGRPEGEEGAFGDAGDTESKSKRRSRVASGGKLTGRKVNKLWRDGAFGKYEGGAEGTDSHKRWTRTRRALNKGQDPGQVALAVALTKDGKGVDPKTGRLDKKQQLALKSATGGTPSQALASSAPEAAPEVAAPAEEQPALASVDTEAIDRLTREVNDIKNARKASDLLPATWKEYKELAKKYQTSYGMSKRESYEAARGALSSKKLNQIARLKNEPGRAQMVANRKRRADKNRARAKKFSGGATDFAGLTDSPGGARLPQTASQRMAPMEEGQLLAVIKEELQNVLNEASKYRAVATTPMGKKLAAAGLVAVGYQGLDRAGQAVLDAQKRRPDLADKILAVAMRQAGEGILSNDLVTALKGIKARPQVAKKAPEKKTTTKTTTVSGTPPPHTMKYGEEGGYVIATATTKDGVVGTGKAKIRGAGGKHSAKTAASMRAKVALMKAARTAGGSAPAPQR